MKMQNTKLALFVLCLFASAASALQYMTLPDGTNYTFGAPVTPPPPLTGIMTLPNGSQVVMNSTLGGQLSNMSNFSSFNALGNHVNAVTEGYFGFALAITFFFIATFAMWNSASNKSVATLAGSFLTVLLVSMLWALGWVTGEVMIASVVLLMICFIIAFFVG